MIEKDLEKIINYSLEGLTDYEIDKKIGDVGSKVRESSIKSLTKLMIDLFTSKYESFITIFNKYVVAYLNGLLKQIGEKMGRMRLAAGDSLQKFFFEFKDEDLSSVIPHYENLRLTFLEDIKFNDNNQINNAEWLEPGSGYRKFTHILLLPEYSQKLFEGLIISMGGITEDTQKCSLEELDNLLKRLDDTSRNNMVKMIYNHIINIFEQNVKEDRVIEPLFNTLTHLLTKNSFINSQFFEFIDKIHKYVTKENYESNNIHKVLSSVDIFYNILYFEKENNFNIFNRSLRSLLVLMTHK